MNRRLKIFKIVLLLSLFLIPSFFAHANKLFDVVSRAVRSRCTKITMERIEKEYKGDRIEGKAYIVSVTEDVSEGVVVTLSTNKDPTSTSAVYITVYVREFIAKDVVKFEPGRYSRFFGEFDGVRMRSIIVRRGFVK